MITKSIANFPINKFVTSFTTSVIKLGVYDYIFILLLIANFLIRIDNYNQTVQWEDANRDYIVARHIIKYHEFPLVGPQTTALNIKNSPVYYYLISVPLIFNDNIVNLIVINVFLQNLVLLFIYLLAKSMFNARVGIIAVILFGFSDKIIEQSITFHQPLVMEPFAYLSYFFLVLSFKTQKYWLLLLSVFFFIFSSSIHYSILGLTPSYLFLVLLVIKSQKQTLRQYGLTILFSLFLYLLFYSPLLIYYFNSGRDLQIVLSQKYLLSLSMISENLVTNLKILLSIFFIRLNDQTILIVGLLLTLASLFYLLLSNLKKSLDNKYLIIIILVLVQFLIATSLLDLSHIHYDIYYVSVTGLFIIALAQIVNIIFEQNLVLKIAGVLIVIIIISISSTRLDYNLIVNLKRSMNKDNQLIRRQVYNPALESVKEEILYIQNKNKYKELNFFQIQVYVGDTHEEYSDTMFWPYLEKALDSKFTKLDSRSVQDIKVINNDEYVFLDCYNTNNVHLCLDTFLNRNPSYHLVKQVYEQHSFQIYLFERSTGS